MKQYQSAEIAQAMRAARSEPSDHLVALIKEWGNDNHRVGTVIRFLVQYDPFGKWYTYLYLKTDRGWATTAKTSVNSSFVTWDQLVTKAVEHGLASQNCDTVHGWKPL